MTKTVQNGYKKNKNSVKNVQEPCRYPLTVKMLASEINCACDSYLVGDNMQESDLRQLIFHYASSAPQLLFDRENPVGFRKTIEKRIGIKRLHLVNQMLEGWQLQLPI